MEESPEEHTNWVSLWAKKESFQERDWTEKENLQVEKKSLLVENLQTEQESLLAEKESLQATNEKHSFKEDLANVTANVRASQAISRRL